MAAPLADRVPVSGRRRHLGLLVTALAAALFVVYLVLWVQLPGSFRTGNDFAPTYAAGQLILHGHGSSVFDEGRIAGTERASAPPGYPVNLPFISPPASALLAAPLANLPFPAAEALYSLAQLLALMVAAMVVALRTRWPLHTPAAFRVAICAAGIGAPTVGALLLFGESDGLLTLGVCAGYLLFVRGHGLAAGAVLGLAVALGKPHLLVGVLVFLLFRRAWRVLSACVATAAAVTVGAVAVRGISTARGFVAAVIHSGIDHPPSGLLGVTGLVASWLGNGAAIRVLGLVGSILVLAICARVGVVSRRAPRHTPGLMAAVFALSLLASPHLLVPDLVMLVPAFIWLYADALGDRPSQRRFASPELLLCGAWLWLGAASIMDAANTSVGFPGRLTPWGLALFAVAAVVAGPSPASAISRLSWLRQTPQQPDGPAVPVPRPLPRSG